MAPDLSAAGTGVAILVGGLGTRLRGITGDALPKPMVEIAGRPFLEYLLMQLASQGFERVCLLSGHAAASIAEHVGDGRRWGLDVAYSEEPGPLGTGGALRLALPRLDGAFTLVMNGDSFLDGSLRQLVDSHAAARTDGVLATIALRHVDDVGRYGSVALDGAGRIVSFREKDEGAGAGLVSTGIYVVERSLIESIPADRPVSLEREIWTAHLDGGLHGLEVRGAFTDIGVPETLAALRADPSALLAAAGAGPEMGPPILFLDRDGVLNEKPAEGAYVDAVESLRILPGVPEALVALRAEVPGLRIAIVTNQRGIARGLVSRVTVDAIHARMIDELGRAGASIDRIELCPHDAGACDCRKPGTGMFERLLRAWPDSTPETSAVVGDSATDIIAGRRIGARTYLVGEPRRRGREAALAEREHATPHEQADSLAVLVADGRLPAWLRLGAAAAGDDAR